MSEAVGDDHGLDRRLLALTATAAFLDTIFFSVLAPLLPHYRDSALSGSSIGLLTAGYALGSLAFAIPAGVLAVRLGPRRVLVASLVGLSIGSIWFGAAAAGLPLVLARLLQGASGAAIWSGSLTWLIEGSPPARKGEAIGIATGVGIFGALAGPAVGAFAALTSPGLIFPMLGLICLAVAVFAGTTRSPGLAAIGGSSQLAGAFRSPSVRRSLFLFTAPAVCFGVMALSAPLRMASLGGGAVLIGLAYTGSAAAEGLLAPVVGRWSDSSGRLKPYTIGLGLAGVAVIAVAFAPSSLLLLLAIIAASAGCGIFVTPAFALLSDSAERTSTYQGIAVSLANVGWSAGQAVGALAAGFLQAGGESLPLVLASAILFGTLLFTLGNQAGPIAGDASRPEAGGLLHCDPPSTYQEVSSLCGGRRGR